MAIYDSLPYTNFHELNADWLLKQMKEAKDKVDSIQDDIDRFNATYAALAAVLTVSGSNVSIPGTMTANGFVGNLTGNASTATTAGHATTADSATSATSATNATVLNSNNELGTDPDTMYEQGKLKMYYGPGFTSHYPTNCNEEPFLLLTADRGLWRLQIAIFPQTSIDLYFRIFNNNNWGTWYSVDKTQAQS